MRNHFPEFTHGVNWFPRKSLRVGYYMYYIELDNGDDWGQRVNRREAIKWLRTIRDLRAKGYDIHWNVLRKWVMHEVNACMYCGSRPSLYEWDCDGFHDTGTCGENQCPVSRRENEKAARRGW